MASKQINSGVPFRIEAGAIVLIDDGSNKYFFNNFEPGTGRVQNGHYEPLPYFDRGALQQALIGNQKRSMIDLGLKLSKSTTAAETMTAIAAQLNSPNDGKVKEWTLTLWDPNFVGATVGTKYVWAQTMFTEQPLRTAGAEFDILDCKWSSRTINAVETHDTAAPT